MAKKTDETLLRTKSWSFEELDLISAARKKIGKDRPTFYHDAIVKEAKEIISSQTAE